MRLVQVQRWRETKRLARCYSQPHHMRLYLGSISCQASSVASVTCSFAKPRSTSQGRWIVFKARIERIMCFSCSAQTFLAHYHPCRCLSSQRLRAKVKSGLLALVSSFHPRPS
ncbi:hypothetical protein MPTK1_5g19070 [Marchantia polymorpha subsp. ruderalis]|uniref:Uncharacterized protein n=2 Tax=Marchantia polymorpha TaxID=3197 RepID=A0AAF6BJY1_MARPO|nr:hypothetical protein MARPO_0073s0036 [Marchantia polymorpha]BBN12315.1 hypothetical protein Mp_5g19070 [Marchantia polymorpha subsp. ruderalis]|eukprot:PTQ35162.1 hypothetical protein MARPO_0073s0036 [Marchantia polymorpha]